MAHLYLGLAAHWRGNAERAEAQLRNAVELEPPGAFAGQSASLLARHLAYHGRADEVMELFESEPTQSKLPSLDRVNGIGSWSCLLSFVEAFYLCGLYEQAASLSPLLEGIRRVRQEMDQPMTAGFWSTRAGLVAAAARRWEEAERHFGIAREVADTHVQPRSSWPTFAAYTPGCCWIEAAPATTSVPPRCSRRQCRLTARLACLPTPQRRNASNVRPVPDGVAWAGL